MLHEISGSSQLVERMLYAIYWVLILSLSAFVVKVSGTAVYNVYFHPLSRFPGPISAAATPIPYVYHLLNGGLVNWLQSLHEKYGGTVRIHPSELSFVEPSAWHDIFMSRPHIPRSELRMFHFPDPVSNMNSTNSLEDHSRMKRIISHAFSERALRDQETILQTYTDLLVEQLQHQVQQAEKGFADVDLTEWYGFTSFDVIGDLLFGESFHSLEDLKHHPWVTAIFQGLKFGMILTAFDHFAPAHLLVRWCLPKSLERKAAIHAQWTRERVDKRIAQGTSRPDFMSYILRNNDEKGGITRKEIDSNAALLILAGSDTSSTTCASTTWFLLKNPPVLERLQKEIRESFTSVEDITVASTSKLPYLHAVILEALRLHPPNPVAVSREVNRPGVVICGHLIPMNTRVGLPAKNAYRLSQNFIDPLSYLPERWLESGNADSKFSTDRKDVFEPFHVGIRKCPGQNLAWAEMNLILTKMIWCFDLERGQGNVDDWSDQKVYGLHEILPLHVKIRTRV